MATKAPNDYDYNDKISFLAEWFDFDSAYHKKFILSYFPSDGTLELFDRDLNRMYLKRSKMDGLDFNDMFVGNTVRIYGRQVKITDYADCRTQGFIGKTKEHTLALLKPRVINILGEVLTQLEEKDFKVTRLRMANLTRKEALMFYEYKKGDAFLPFIVEDVVSGPVVAVELVGVNAVSRLKETLGPVDPIEGRKTSPNSLRAIYGKERSSNGFHCAEDYKEAVKEACFFFPEGIDAKPPAVTITLNNSTCCVIKPHAIKEGKLGYIISYINDSHFKITAMQMFYLSNANADEFLEVYKGIVSDYHALLLSFVDGPCVAMEISSENNDVNVHQEFRKFVGPADSDIARQIRPHTLRAKFGCDKYRNAVHCTDLPEDTKLELEYFFKILSN